MTAAAFPELAPEEPDRRQRCADVSAVQERLKRTLTRLSDGSTRCCAAVSGVTLGRLNGERQDLLIRGLCQKDVVRLAARFTGSMTELLSGGTGSPSSAIVDPVGPGTASFPTV